MSQASSQEAARSHQAVCVGLYSMGGFWSLRRPWEFTRSIVMSLVQISALCGLEAFLITKHHSASSDATVAHVPRVAMRGRASWQTESGATRTLTTEGAPRHWRICETRIEHGIRRLNWYK
eukprot:4725744-Pyramimonas_sp.AAC.1